MEPEPELADDTWVGVQKKFDGELKDWEHSLPVEVFISDTDSYAIIYHTVYHKYFERARVEFLGVRELMRLRQEDGVVLRELETRHIRFFDSGLLGDLCTVVTKLVELDASRIVMEHRFVRDRDKKLLTRGVCELGFLDVASGALVPIPPTLLRGFASDATQHIPRNAISSIFGGAPKPYDWLSDTVAPYVWKTTCYGDTVDGSGEASHPNVLDMFERCRSAGLGGAVVLKQRSEEANNAYVVGRIDRAKYVTIDPAVFGDRLEVRSVVELKFKKAGIIFHQSLWRAGGAKPLVDCAVSVYSIDKATKKPVPVPADVEASLTPFLISAPQ